MKKHIGIIFALSVLLTILFQFNLTQAIFLGDYLKTEDIVLGRADRSYYLMLVNESGKGNWELGSPFLKEWSRSLYLYPALNINLVGLLQQIFDANIKTVFIVMDYFAVFLLFVLAFVLFLVMFRGDNFGYFVALGYMFLPRMLIWDRTISPQVNFLFLFLFLIAYFASSRDRFLWKRELALGATAGLLFYTYTYHWTFAMPLLVLSDAWSFLRQRKISYHYFYKYAVILFMSPWFLIHMWRLHHLAYYEESARRIGALYSRFPAGFYTQAGILVLLISFFLIRKYIFSHYHFDTANINSFEKILLGLVASLVVLNQQMITGMQLEFNSHYLPVILIFIVAFFGGIIFIFMNGMSRFRYAFLSGAIAVALILVIHATLVRFRDNPFADKQNYLSSPAMQALQWFRHNNIRNQVIYAPRELGVKTILLTGNYLYFHAEQELQIIPTAELVDRFTYFDITNQNITDNLSKYQQAMFGQTFNAVREKNNVINKIKVFLFMEEFVPETLDRYLTYDFEPMYNKRSHLDIDAFIKTLDRYHVSYMLYSTNDKDSIYQDVPGRIVFTNDAYLIKAR